jgi:pimeloyl-ACP methyl ester carboxylesterase
MSTTSTTRSLQLGGVRLQVTVGGEGPPLLLLHGFPQSGAVWDAVVAELPMRRSIRPDLRGAGASDVPRGGYGLASQIAELRALLDALELDRVDIVAHDWAALVALGLAFASPERLRRLVTVGVPHPFIRISPALVRTMPSMWFDFVLAAPGIGPATLRRGRQRILRTLLVDYCARERSDDEIEGYLAPYRDPARARAGSALYRRLILPTFLAILAGRYRRRRLEVPTLVAYGADDPIVARMGMRSASRWAAHLEVHALAGASHFVPEERPAELARVIRVFLDGDAAQRDSGSSAAATGPVAGSADAASGEA